MNTLIFLLAWLIAASLIWFVYWCMFENNKINKV